MSKFGVGVGEEFPVDENVASQENGETGGCCGTRGERLHAAARQWHEQKRQWRRQKRAEWRERKQAMREKFHREFIGDGEAQAAHRSAARHLAVGALVLVGLAALLGHRHHDN